MNEEWKDIANFEGLYQVSNLGRVRNNKSGTILKPHLDGKKNYLQICLHKNGEKKHTQIHRLVAIAFLDNYNNYPCVNHKDENKTNNHVSNLEWCSRKYNSNYGNGMKRMIESRRANNDMADIVRRVKETKIKNHSYSAERPVNQFTWNGEFVARYASAEDAKRRTGINGIGNACQYKRKRAGNYLWAYDEDVPNIKDRILKAHPNAKPIDQYTLDGTFIKTWDRAMDICKELGVNPASLSECCHGKRHKTKGYIWKFHTNN